MSTPAAASALAIDVGSSSVKTAIVTAGGEIRAATSRPVETKRFEDGGAEQDPEQLWQAVVDACREVAATAPGEIAAITCSGQYFSIIPVREDGEPVGPLILWLDTRGSEHSLAIYEKHPDSLLQWMVTNGLFPLPSGSDSISHSLYLRDQRPEVYARAQRLLEPCDYVNARLTGRCVASPCSAFAQGLTDNRNLDAVRYDDELIALSGLDRHLLPELVADGSVIAPLADEIARDLGIASRPPVFAGINDTQAVSIGSGVFRPGRGGINVGTTCQVLGFLDQLRSDLDNNLFSMPSPIAGRYALMAENGLGGKLIDHLLGELIFASDHLADHASGQGYQGFDSALAAVSPGANGLLYLPWLTGSQTPKARSTMRGGFLNMSLDTTREHLLRAAVEGITFSLSWQLPAAETLCGDRFDELTFSGGGAISRQWAQAVADITDRPVRRLAEPRYVNNRATALLAFERLGVASLGNVDEFCPVADTFAPRPETRDTYDRMFEQFRDLFERLSPVFHNLNAPRA